MFFFDQLPDCVIVEAIDALVPSVWHRLGDAVPFVGDWTWHERTMWHLLHKDVLVRQRADGSKDWYLNGQQHRVSDLPASMSNSGTKSWYKNDQRHRENDLPAIEWASGGKWWCLRGQLHRENGLPAIERSSGNAEWYVNNQRHREGDLPAIEWADGSKMVVCQWRTASRQWATCSGESLWLEGVAC